MILSFASFKGNISHKSLIINDSGVSQLCFPVFHCYQTGIPFCHGRNFLFYVFIAYIILNFRNFYTFVIFNGNLRLYRNFRGQHQINVRTNFLDIHFWMIHRRNFSFFHCFIICIRKHKVNRIFIKNFRTIHFFNHKFRSFPLTEPWNLNLFHIFTVRPHHAVLKRFLIYGKF